MTAFQEGVVSNFFRCLTQWNYDKAIDYMDKQGRGVLWDIWPDSLSDILCDFALAEKNYSETNFEPVKNKTTERKEDKSYLDFVYRAFYQDLEKLQPNVTNGSYVSRLITSLLHFISVRLKLLEFYNKLYEIGSTSNFIDFNELSEVIEMIQCECSYPSPVEGILKIIQYELNCLKHLFKCHEYLDNWMFLESVIHLKKGSIAFSSWEDSIENKETRRMDSIFVHNNHVPALMFWFLRFKRMTLLKFTLYFHGVFLKMDSEEVINHCVKNDLFIIPRFQLLQKKSEARNVLLVYDASHIRDYKGPTYFCPDRVMKGPYIKYPVMLCFPELETKGKEYKINELELFMSRLISRKKKEDVSMNEFDLITYEKENTFLSIRVDSKVYLLMFYDSKPKNEDKDKANVSEFVSLLRCHRFFTSINK